MSLIRWEPFTAMDDMLNRFPAWFGRWPRLPGALETSSEWAPSVDISETEGEYLIRASLPGVKKEDAKVMIEDGMLTLSGERQQQEEQKDEKFHKMESFYGSFSRSFALPDAVDENAVRADSKDGVLTVHVPKARVETKKPTTIKVQ
ncbi:MAG TPA: Hsp20/alpha crystallin family protein [Steroidobacteraceae bacterium]|jgi:HSP20 family protein|nr:Hsp20/alpha crystallin family protein [Steroidobacteraceae bacterium]